MSEQTKSILITQSQLRRYSGSEVVTLELAEFFSNSGWNVTILTHHAGEPATKDLDGLSNVKVVKTTTVKPGDMSINDFDVIWLHHYTLTENLLEQIIHSRERKNGPIVIFHHMSFIDPLEFPYFCQLENQLADAVLFNSQETRDELIKRGGCEFDDDKIYVFDNAAPDRFLINHTTNPNRKKLNIAVVSNHPPDEVVEASKLLEDAGVAVNFIGRVEQGEVKRVTPEILRNYDAVVSIGKTVQYSLLAKVPIYCYDRFGGPGYISSDNFDLAHYHNFSGRGFGAKTAKQIFHDLQKPSMPTGLDDNHIKDSFVLSKKIDDLFAKVKSSESNEWVDETSSIAAFRNHVVLLSRLVPGSAHDMYIARPKMQELINKYDDQISRYNELKDKYEANKQHLDAVLNGKIMKTVSFAKKYLLFWRANK